MTSFASSTPIPSLEIAWRSDELDRARAARRRDAPRADRTLGCRGRVGARRNPLGLLLIDGLLLRDLDLGRRASTEVLGFGDILRPSDTDSANSDLPFVAR